MVDCIRVWGSPEIAADLELTVPQGRNTPLQMTMHVVKVQAAALPKVEGAAPKTDPRVITSWEILGWTEEERRASRNEFEGTGSEYLAHLSALIDQHDAAEVA